ncbi:MAG: ATP-binding protein [Polyangiaceae bacterium]|nr:ATP-binding protein [Polyangiaceae bacterium]
MQLLELTSHGFKIPDGTYSFREKEQPSNVVIVRGDPGSGKTLFLRLLAAWKETVAPVGLAPDLRRFLRIDKTTGRLSVTVLFNEAERKRAKLETSQHRVVVEVEPAGSAFQLPPNMEYAFHPFEKTEPATRWEFFPAHRSLRVEDFRLPHPPVSPALEAAKRLTVNSDKYALFRRVFHNIALEQAAGIATLLDRRGVALRSEQPDLFASYKKALATMTPDLRLTGVEIGKDCSTPRFLRRDGHSLPIEELTASEEQAALFAFAYVWLQLNGAVVLIDTPELHIAPPDQLSFLDNVLCLGSSNQTFIATQSPELFNFPGATVIHLTKPDGERT